MKTVIYFYACFLLGLNFGVKYVFGFHASRALVGKLVKAKIFTLRSSPEDEKDGAPLVQFGSQKYYEGLIKEPVASKNAREVDNLTPNLKFIGICAGMIGGLLLLFYLSNKDIPPPSY